MTKEELLALIQRLTDAFYQNKAEEGVGKLPELVQSLSDYALELNENQVQRYIMILKNLMEAMEMEDYVMIADILTFDILEYFE